MDSMVPCGDDCPVNSKKPLNLFALSLYPPRYEMILPQGCVIIILKSSNCHVFIISFFLKNYYCIYYVPSKLTFLSN